MSAGGVTSPARRAGHIWLLWLVAIVLSVYAREDVRGWLRTSISRLREAAESAPVEPAAVQTADTFAAVAVVPAAAPSETAPVAIRRVLMVGASTIQFHLGVELERALRDRYPALAIQRVGKLSTGLTRPDVFDWPAALRGLVAETHPDLVLINFGGNDAQGMVLAGGDVATYGSSRWEATYRERVRDIVGIGRSGGARVVMLGMSSTRDPALSRRMERINLLTDQAARAAGGEFLPIWDLGANSAGKFQDVIMVGTVPTRTRLADGKHLSRAGGAYVAREIRERLAQRYAFVSAAEPARVGLDNGAQP